MRLGMKDSIHQSMKHVLKILICQFGSSSSRDSVATWGLLIVSAGCSGGFLMFLQGFFTVGRYLMKENVFAPKESPSISKNLKESHRTSKNLKESQRISKNLKEFQKNQWERILKISQTSKRISENPEKYERILKIPRAFKKISKNLKTSLRILENLKPFQRILRNLNVTEKISKNLKPSQRILKNLQESRKI